MHLVAYVKEPDIYGLSNAIVWKIKKSISREKNYQ
jgi:hypothetical protein